MTRIFTGLAVLSLALLLANMFHGLLFGDFNAEANRLRAAHNQLEGAKREAANDSDQVTRAKSEFDRVSLETRSIRQHAEYHKLLGLGAAIVTILVNSIVVTYFIGTSRWCQEVIDTYQLSTDYVAQSKRLKRRTFPWSLIGMLSVLAISGCGAASDPLNSLPSSAQWVPIHLSVALGGIALIVVSFIAQSASLKSNLELIRRIMEDVERIRGEKHLDAAPSSALSP